VVRTSCDACLFYVCVCVCVLCGSSIVNNNARKAHRIGHQLVEEAMAKAFSRESVDSMMRVLAMRCRQAGACV